MYTLSTLKAGIEAYLKDNPENGDLPVELMVNGDVQPISHFYRMKKSHEYRKGYFLLTD